MSHASVKNLVLNWFQEHDETSIIPDNESLASDLAKKSLQAIQDTHWKNVTPNLIHAFAKAQLLLFHVLFKDAAEDSVDYDKLVRWIGLLDHILIVKGTDSTVLAIIQKLESCFYKVLEKGNCQYTKSHSVSLPYSVSPGCLAVPRLVCPDILEFMQRSAQPLVLLDCIEDWPALSKWQSMGFILKTAGHRLVPVEIGGDYRQQGWSQCLMTIRDYFDRFVFQPTDKIGYIAQYNFLRHVPALAKDITMPDYCHVGLEGSADNVIVNGWLGMAGTTTPLHFDKYHNIFVQVVGRKLIRLYAQSQTFRLYPFSSDSDLQNTSQVDLGNVDLARFPLFPDAPFYEVVLEAGQMLYIPQGWWHHVRSTTFSISISFWF